MGLGVVDTNNLFCSPGACDTSAAARFRDAVQAGSARPAAETELVEVPLDLPGARVRYRADHSVVIEIGDPPAVDSTAATREASAAARVAVDIPEEMAITSWLNSFIPTGLAEEIRAALLPHLDEVGRRLVEKGERLEDIRGLVEKAMVRDLWAALACGAANALPSMTAGAVGDFTPHFFAQSETRGNPLGEAASVAAQAAAFEHGADVVGCYALAAGLTPPDAGDRYYLAPKADKLVEPAAAALERMEPGLCEAFWSRFLVNQVSPVRNAMLIPVAAAVEALTSALFAAKCDLVLNSVLRLSGGAAWECFRYCVEYRGGRRGPLWLFARRDWEAAYDQLKASSTRDVALNVGRKVVRLPLDTANAAIADVKAFCRGEGGPLPRLAENVAFGGFLIGGMSLVGVTRAGVKGRVESWGASRYGGDLAGRSVALAVRVPVSGIYGNAAALKGVAIAAKHAKDAVSRRLETALGGAPARAIEAPAPDAAAVEPRQPPAEASHLFEYSCTA